MDNDRYMELFAEESKEHIQVLNDNLLELESNKGNIESINEIFRAAHTLKGMAGSLGFNVIAEITHSMENVLDEVRNQRKEITVDLIDILLECTDTLEIMVENVIDMGQEGTIDVRDLLDKLSSSATNSQEHGVDRSHNAATKLDQYQTSIINVGIQQGLTPYWITIVLQPTCLLKAARAYIVFQKLEDLGEIIKSVPQVQDIEEEKFEDTFKVLIITQHSQDDIKSDLESISELRSVDIQKLDIKSINNKNIDTDNHSPIQGKEQNNRLSNNQHRASSTNTNRQIRGIRVDTERLDYLMNLVSELITIKNTMEGIVGYDDKPGMVESMEYLTRITNELHDAVMNVRMVPIDMVFNRFPRIVRDLAKNTQKKVNLNVIGSDTEIDRTIVDEIGDPLIHLLRNAIDHGIELPYDRIQMGKDSTGTVDLIAYHDGNNVVIEIRDDGRGIDFKNIINTAVNKGLISEDKVESLMEKEILDLMFQPGFSTAQSVSDISGRGVGMDVVKTKIESLGGVIDVETKVGMGSRFIIRLPLTLSIIQALLVEVSDEIFAIPLNSIQEIIDIPLGEVNYLRGQEVIPYRGSLIPLILLDEELNIGKEEHQKDIMTVVVIKKGEKQSALSIGNLLGQQEIVIKSLGKYLSDIKVISGATILGDGRVALILDINRLV